MANMLAVPIVPMAQTDTNLLTRESPLSEVSVWQARSTYAAILSGSFIVATGLGFNPDPGSPCIICPPAGPSTRWRS